MAEIMANGRYGIGSRNYGRCLPALEALSRAAICYEGSPGIESSIVEYWAPSIYEAFEGEFWTRVQYWIEGLDFSKKNLTVWSTSFGNPQNEISLSFHVFIGSN